MWELAVPVAIGVIVVLVIGLLLAKLYRRSTRDEAYVRTGLGGQKVVLDGGSLVLPVFHSTAAVNLKTLRLEVARGGPDSLITKDRMRVDIGAEFYVRVKPDASSIALAAQTLGSRTNEASELRELIEAKFVDGLRSVAATMNLEELQEQRATFVKSVQDAVGADIQNNGLELESVSLTRLDQSDIKHFNPSNFFDAHGLTTLTRITREREQERNQIVRTTEVNIAQQDLVARQTTLTIESTKREAELAQQRDIANMTAAMRAEAAKVEQTAFQNEAEYQIQQELAVANKQTEANQARDTRKIEADLAVKRRTTEVERELQIVAQEAAIIVATKSTEQSDAQTIAETARALAISAEEKVTTARATEIAERDKVINVIAARKAAETNAMPIRRTRPINRGQRPPGGPPAPPAVPPAPLPVAQAPPAVPPAPLPVRVTAPPAVPPAPLPVLTAPVPVPPVPVAGLPVGDDAAPVPVPGEPAVPVPASGPAAGAARAAAVAVAPAAAVGVPILIVVATRHRQTEHRRDDRRLDAILPGHGFSSFFSRFRRLLGARGLGTEPTIRIRGVRPGGTTGGRPARPVPTPGLVRGCKPECRRPPARQMAATRCRGAPPRAVFSRRTPWSTTP